MRTTTRVTISSNVVMRYVKLLTLTALAVFCLAGCEGRTAYEEAGSSIVTDPPVVDTAPDGQTPPSSSSSATAEEESGTAISQLTTVVGQPTDTPEVGTTTDDRTEGADGVTTAGSTAIVRTTGKRASTSKRTSGAATTSGVDNVAEDSFAPVTTAGKPVGVTTRSSAVPPDKTTVYTTVTASKAITEVTSTTKAATTERVVTTKGVTTTEKVTTTKKADTTKETTTTKEKVTTVTTTGSTTRRTTRRTSDDPNWSPFY